MFTHVNSPKEPPNKNKFTSMTREKRYKKNKKVLPLQYKYTWDNRKHNQCLRLSQEAWPSSAPIIG